MKRTAKGFQRQMFVVQDLALAPTHADYVVTEYRTFEAGHHVQVVRKFKRRDLNNIEYRECFMVGPRGAVETIYSHLEY